MNREHFKIHYMRDKGNRRCLPFQHYDEYGFITFPADGKRVLIRDWSNKKESIPPTFINQNICILTGAASGITVVDFDSADGGMKLFRKLFTQHDIPKTPIVVTPTGIHMYFTYDNDIPTMNRIIVNGERTGVDVKNNRAIVIAPPSVVDEKRYRFKHGHSLVDTRVSKMPAWLRKFLFDHIKPSTAKRIQAS